MKSLSVPHIAAVLALIIALTIPSVTQAHFGYPLLLTKDMPFADFIPWSTDLDQSVVTGDYAIHVHESGTYSDDGVVLPVFEALEARYAATNREFTVEYWFTLSSGYNSNGKELFDHHVPSYEGFWTAFQNGQLWAGIDTKPLEDNAAIHAQTGSGFNDGKWHHYALVRDLNASPDRLCLYLDGVGTCYTDGSNSQWAHVYENIRSANNRDGTDDNNYPLYVIGARTSGAGEIEATVDELRISDVARYRSDFTPRTTPFALDANTVMLFHFDEGAGNTTYGRDSSNSLIAGTLVQDIGWYGIGATPLAPGDPSDAAWLAKMWTQGRFGSVSSSLTLTSPNGGEVWLAGSQHEIKWTWTGTITNVGLRYSTDGFATAGQPIVASTPNDGAYTWTTPITPSKTTRVRVTDASHPDVYDDSDANFVLASTIYFAFLPTVLKNWM